VGGGFVAELENLDAGGVRLEEGVVEDGGEILRGGQGMGGEGCGVEVLWAVGEGIGDGEGAQVLAPSRWCSARVLSIIRGLRLAVVGHPTG